jgi:molybdopterin adenylyltransferase
VIAERLRLWVAGNLANLILTTGGTGISARDNTPEATRQVLQRELPGVAELLRQRGLEQTSYSVLSRALVGTAERTLIVNLPGSPQGALFSLNVVQPLVPHVLRLLGGHTEHGPQVDTRNSDSEQGILRMMNRSEQ